jgi:dsDNA-binding SOS-regulon protein
VEHQVQRSQTLDEQLQVSAIEIQSLANSFATAVQALLDGQQKTLDRLQHTEQTMAQSMSRSDEQLAYYVAQAKEVIELSLSAQQPMLQALERVSHDSTRQERA